MKLNVYAYDWKNVDDNSGTFMINVPDELDVKSFQAGYAAAEAELDCVISNWRHRPDLRMFRVHSRHKSFDTEYETVSTTAATSERLLRAELSKNAATPDASHCLISYEIECADDEND